MVMIVIVISLSQRLMAMGTYNVIGYLWVVVHQLTDQLTDKRASDCSMSCDNKTHHAVMSDGVTNPYLPL